MIANYVFLFKQFKWDDPERSEWLRILSSKTHDLTYWYDLAYKYFTMDLHTSLSLEIAAICINDANIATVLRLRFPDRILCSWNKNENENQIVEYDYSHLIS